MVTLALFLAVAVPLSILPGALSGRRNERKENR